MRIHVASRWNKIREGFWLIPSTFILFFFTLGNIMVFLDKRSQDWGAQHLSGFFGGNPEWAKSILSGVAASAIAAVTLVISVTIVALTLASQQFGPRLLRNFLRDSTTKVILGMFFSTAAFSFAVRFRMQDGLVPYLSMGIVGILAVLDTFLLILFVHHISVSIHVSHVIARVSGDYSVAVLKLFPRKLLEAASVPTEATAPQALPPNFDRESRLIVSNESGYLQAMDYEYLLELAAEKDFILKLHLRPGEFAAKDTPLASVWPASRETKSLHRRVNAAIFLGYERTLTQDVEFAINQLVEMAVRALSPAINDPFTATRCLNRLGQGLIELSSIHWPSANVYDDEGNLRLILKTIDFPKMVQASFNLIRQNGIQSPLVMITLLKTIGMVLPFAHTEDDREVLKQQADMAERGSRQSIPEEYDRAQVKRAYEAVLEKYNK